MTMKFLSDFLSLNKNAFSQQKSFRKKVSQKHISLQKSCYFTHFFTSHGPVTQYNVSPTLFSHDTRRGKEGNGPINLPDFSRGYDWRRRRRRRQKPTILREEEGRGGYFPFFFFSPVGQIQGRAAERNVKRVLKGETVPVVPWFPALLDALIRTSCVYNSVIRAKIIIQKKLKISGNYNPSVKTIAFNTYFFFPGHPGGR